MNAQGCLVLLVLLMLGAILAPHHDAPDCSTSTHAACHPVPTPGPADVERMGRR